MGQAAPSPPTALTPTPTEAPTTNSPRPTTTTQTDIHSEPQYDSEFLPQYDVPLYTEINIPLPPLPSTLMTATPACPSALLPNLKQRDRVHSLHGFSPFHRRRSSSHVGLQATERSGNEKPRIELSMRAVGKGTKPRSGILGAAIGPAMMVLRAELFMPEDKEGRGMNTKDRLEVGR